MASLQGLDSTDLEILKLFAIHGPTSLFEITEFLGVLPDKAFYARIRKLLKNFYLSLEHEADQAILRVYSVSAGVSLHEVVRAAQEDKPGVETDFDHLQYQIENAKNLMGGAFIDFLERRNEEINTIQDQIDEIQNQFDTLKENTLALIRSLDRESIDLSDISLPGFNEDWPDAIKLKWFDAVIAVNMGHVSRIHLDLLDQR